MKKIPKTMLGVLFTISTLGSITSCTTNRVTESKTIKLTEQIKEQEKTTVNEKQKEPETRPKKETHSELKLETEIVEEAKDSFATIVSFGDALCHMPVDNAAYDEEAEVYDFSSMFNRIKRKRKMC